MEDKSDTKCQFLIDNNFDAIIELDISGSFIFANSQVSNIYGYYPEELIGLNSFNFVHPEDLESMKLSVDEAFKTGKTKTMKFRIHHKDGHYISVFAKGSRIMDDGKIKFIVIVREISEYINEQTEHKTTFFISRDITELKTIEEKLRESEEKFKSILENMVEGYFEVDLKGNYTFANDFFCNMLGYSKGEVIGKNYRSFSDEEIKKIMFNKFNQVYRTEIPLPTNTETIARTNKGRLIVYEGIIDLKRDSKGNKVGFYGLARDITDRKKAEQKLKESEEKYRHLFNSTPYAIWLVNLRGIIIDCNSTMNKFMSILKKEDLVGNNFRDVIKLFLSTGDPRFENLEKVFRERFKLLLKQGYLDPIEFEISRGDGKTFWITLETSFVKFGSESLIQVFIKDITESKESEIKIKESEEKFRLLVENINDLIIVQNDKFEYEFINEQIFMDVLGYSKTDLIGKTNIDLIHPEDVKGAILAASKILRKGSGAHQERFRCLDGDYKWLERTGKTFFNSKGEKKFISVLRNITERKKTEQKLKESEEKYRIVINSLGDPLHVVDEDFQFVMVNSALEKWVKDFDIQQDFIGRKVFEVFPFLPNKIRNEYQLVFEEGKTLITEEITFIANKEVFTETRKIPIYNKGKVNQVITILRDVTEKKRAEEKLIKSEYRLRERVKELSCLFGISQLLERSDISVDDIIKGTLDLIPPAWQFPEITCSTIKYDNKIFQTDNFIETKWKLTTNLRINEKLLVIEGYCFEDKPFLEEEKLLINDVGNRLKIIIEQKEAEQKLRESEEKYRVLFERSPYSIFISDLEGKIIDINPASIKLFGFKPKELIGKNYLELHLFSLEMTNISKKRLKSLLNRENIESIEFQVKNKNGDIIWVNFNVSYLKIGEEDCFQIIIQDITDKKINEELIKEQIKKLSEINKFKTDLLNRTSHELKTPLISIKGYTDLLLTKYSERMGYYITNAIKEIKNGCQRLENIVYELLNSSNLESGQIFLKLAKDDLSILIKTVVKDLYLMAKERKHTISLDLYNNLITKYERERIYEVISNLLSNAIKNTPIGGKISIKSEVEKDFYVISVKDNGIGLTEEEKKRIFNQFGKIERYGKGWNLDIEGTGLGLYIAKRIVDLHGGSIWVESEGRHRGSTFYFSLPIIE